MTPGRLPSIMTSTLSASLEAVVSPLIGTDVDRQRAEPGIDDWIRVPVAARTVDAKHLGSEIRQQHRGVRSRTDAGKLHDAES